MSTSSKFAKIRPIHWNGPEARYARSQGQTVQLVWHYLLSGPNFEWLGIYHLPLPLLAHETGCDPEGALEALRRLSHGGAAYYDELTEEVFVPSMARTHIGETLKENDNLLKAIKKRLEEIRSSRFFNHFLDIYAIPYHLENVARSTAESFDLTSPFEAPPEPLGSPSGRSKKEELRTKNQELRIKKQETRTKNQEQILVTFPPNESPSEAPSKALPRSLRLRPHTNGNGTSEETTANGSDTTRAVWAAYSSAYRIVYGAAPVRNKIINSQIRQLVERLGADAPEVARFFLHSKNSYYVGKGHSVGALLADCEKLRTEWATGRRMTQTAARQADKLQTHGEIAQRLLEKADA